MKLLLLAAGILVSALAAAVVARRRRYRNDGTVADTVEPVSGDWLAHARSHEDQPW
jgi:hypothetical protein